ncbi:hypothetical protein [Streptomyces olindensis]|uniref:hypothetical protein n=1 Tax=Streptomyces olindensis TaxID=358823 RepID=UPI00340E4025
MEILGRLRSDRAVHRSTPPHVNNPKADRPSKHGGVPYIRPAHHRKGTKPAELKR